MAWVDNLEWDRAIEASDGVAIGAGLETDDPDSDRCESLEVLYRPQELLVAREVWEEKGNPLRRRIDAIGGRPLAEFPRDEDRDPRRAETAERLGLRLVWLPDHDPLGLLRDVRRIDGFDIDGASVNHVTIAGPQRHGGDSPPVPVEPKSMQIPPSGVQEGRGVRIAVLDTGLVNPEPAGFEFEKRGPEDDDPFPPAGLAVGHGTLVAGVIATYAPMATLVIRRVLATPLGEADELEVGQALLDVARAEPHIVNASFSGFAVDRKTMLAFRAAVEQVAETTLLVAAVGNEGLARRAYMAAFEGVCGVASVEREDGKLRIADYSNRGDYVEFCAEGTDVESTFTTGHAVASGTSFAAPKVTAAVAITMSREGKSAHEAADQLRNDTAQPLIPQAGRFVVPT